MQADNVIQRRKSIRLKDYDYSSSGGYFVTICTRGKECLFGRIVHEEMKLSSIGKIVYQCWNEISGHFPNVELDAFVVMPNHVHGILILHEPPVGVEYIQPLQGKYQHVVSNSVPSIIRSFKAAVTRECGKQHIQRFQWQRNYYDHIVRDEKSLHAIREYIVYNPLKWYDDEENPDNLHF